MTATDRIFALDSRGQKGLEMSHEDLLRCQTEERHKGQIFVCGNTNLIWNDIRMTCLGAIFFNHHEDEQRCDHLLTNTFTERVRQVSRTEVLIFAASNMTVTEKFKNGTQYHPIKEGLVWKATAPGCQLSTRDFTFRSLEDINLSENNFE